MVEYFVPQQLSGDFPLYDPLPPTTPGNHASISHQAEEAQGPSPNAELFYSWIDKNETLFFFFLSSALPVEYPPSLTRTKPPITLR